MKLEKLLEGKTKEQQRNIKRLFAEMQCAPPLDPNHYEVEPYMVRGHLRSFRRRKRLVLVGKNVHIHHNS